jgi:autotransporter adhesin
MLIRRILLVFCAALLMVGALGGVPVAAQQAASLSGMLSTLPETASSRTLLWYGAIGDLAQVLGLQINTLQDVTNLPNASRLAYLAEIGQQIYYSSYSGLANPTEWQAAYGINSFAIQRELTVGAGNGQYAVLDGAFDAGQIRETLATNGYQQSQIGGVVAFLAGNSGANQVSGGRFGAVIASNTRLLVAPRAETLEALATAGNPITSNPDYAALAAALDSDQTAPNTRLLCAVLFGADYFAQNMVASASPGPDGLPGYNVGGIGYRRGSNGRALVIALVYNDVNTANAAGGVLIQRLQNFVRQSEPDRLAFEGWAFSAQVFNVGGRAVLAIASNYPPEADLAWISLVQERDLGFLRIQ